MEVLDFELHFLAQVLVQRAQRFVHQQHARVVDGGARQGDALLLSAGKLRGQPVAERRQPHGLQHALDTALAISGAGSRRRRSGKATLSNTFMCGKRA